METTLNRYDRQLRIWGQQGQSLLDESHICIVSRDDSLLEETLKNLVQLGILHFTIINKVKYTPESLHERLRRMAVKEVKLTITVLEEVKDWKQFDIIIRDNINTVIPKVTVPILTVYVTGLYGFLQLYLHEPHCVIDVHNEYHKPDLRLDQPWPELKQYFEEVNLVGCPVEIASTWPFPVILYKLMETLDSDATTKDLKTALRDIFLKKWVKNSSGSLNYLEATRFASRAYIKFEYDQYINELQQNIVPYFEKMEIQCSNILNKQIAEMFIVMNNFIRTNEMKLPLQGEFPDMECNNDEYQRFKQIYDQFRYDYLKSFEKEVMKVDESVTSELMNTFCKNLMEIVILKPNDNKSSNPSELYQLLIKSQSPDFDKDKVSTKFPQFSNKPIYPVYAFMGGLLSQEVVKLITHQFVPIDNTFIYDGINGENSQTIRI